MTEHTGVKLSGEPQLLARYRSALAALPVTFRENASATVLALDGTDPEWVTRIAEADPVAVIVVDPVATRSTPGGAAVLDMAWSGGPVGRNVPQASDKTVGLVTVAFELGQEDPRRFKDAAVDALTVVVRALGGPVKFDRWRETSHVVVASGQVGEATLRLSGLRSKAGRGTARIVLRASATAIEVTLPGRGAAWPASVCLVDMDGARMLPSEYSDAHRTSLAVAAGATANDLPSFREATEAVLAAQGARDAGLEGMR